MVFQQFGANCRPVCCQSCSMYVYFWLPLTALPYPGSQRTKLCATVSSWRTLCLTRSSHLDLFYMVICRLCPAHCLILPQVQPGYNAQIQVQLNCPSNMYSFNLLFSVLTHIVALVVNNINGLSFCYVFQNFLRKRFPSQANRSLNYWQIMCHFWKIRQNKWLFKKPVCYKQLNIAV